MVFVAYWYYTERSQKAHLGRKIILRYKYVGGIYVEEKDRQAIQYRSRYFGQIGFPHVRKPGDWANLGYIAIYRETTSVLQV